MARTPHGRQASRPNSNSCSASAASYLAAAAVRPGCHLYAMGAYDRWATSPSRAALPEPPSHRPSASPSMEGTLRDEHAQVGRVNPNHPAALRLGILRGPIPRSSLTSSRVTRGRGGKVGAVPVNYDSDPMLAPAGAPSTLDKVVIRPGGKWWSTY